MIRLISKKSLIAVMLFVFILGSALSSIGHAQQPQSEFQANMDALNRMSINSLNDSMKHSPLSAGIYENDQIKGSLARGYCPGFEERVGRLASSFIEQCFVPEATEALKNCKAIFDPSKPKEVLENAAICLNSLADKTDFSDPLDWVTGALTGSIKCTLKSFIVGTTDLEVDQKAALNAIDFATYTWDDLTSLSTIARSIATDGPAALLGALKIDIKGNDGDKSSVSVIDWAAELRKVSDDPLGYAQAQTTEKLWNRKAEVLKKLVSEPTQSIEELMDWSYPDRELGRTKVMLEQCELADAQLVWSLQRISMEKEIADQRSRVNHYHHETMCSLTRGAINFDNASSPMKKLWLDQSDYHKWQGELQKHNEMVKKYISFRQKEAEFDKNYERALGKLTPFLDDAKRLTETVRANTRVCTSTIMSTVPISPDELKYKIDNLRSSMVGSGCSLKAAKSYTEPSLNALANAEYDWSRFIAEAKYALSSGTACTPENTRELYENLQLKMDSAFGGMRQMMECRPENDKQVVTNITKLTNELSLLDSIVTEAAAKIEACDPDKAKEKISQARKFLADLPCNSSKGAELRNRILTSLEIKADLPDCGNNSKPGDYILRIAGSGYVPHYSGGSWKTVGYHDQILSLTPEQNLADEMLSVLQHYKEDPCTAEMPAVPSQHKTPVIWQSGPKVEVILGPVAKLRNVPDLELENTWFLDEKSNHPPLTVLKDKACRGGKK